MGRIQSLQALRFIAAAMVVLCHASPAFPTGAAGVDIFFVISGFVISQRRATPAAFVRARLVRIFPMYLVCSAPWAAVAISQGLMTPQVALSSATLWPVYGEVVRPVLKSGWTLSFELLFYAAMAATLWRPRLGWKLWGIYALAMIGAFFTKAPLLTFIGNPLILEFGMGVLIARAPKGFREIAIGLALAGFAAAWGTNFTIGQAFDMSAPQRVIVWGIPAALLVYGLVQFEGPVWRPLSYLGDASYSIYLTNLATLILLPVAWPISAAAAIAVGAGAYQFVERPLLAAARQSFAAAVPA